MSCLCQHFSFCILDNYSPRILLYLYAAEIGTVTDGIAALCCAPHLSITFCLETIAEHHVLLIHILRLYGSGQHTYACCSWGDELNLYLQVWVVVVGSIREVKLLHLYRPVAVQVESLTRRHPVAFPLYLSFAFCSVEANQRVGKEIGV